MPWVFDFLSCLTTWPELSGGGTYTGVTRATVLQLPFTKQNGAACRLISFQEVSGKELHF